MHEILQQISEDLRIPTDVLASAYKYAHSRYRIVKIPKKSGGYRIALQPAAELKPILEWLMRVAIGKMPVHRIATAFTKNGSILVNAQRHKASRYSVRVDIEAFFPSLTKLDFYRCQGKSSELLPPPMRTPEFWQFIGHTCFDRNGRLPIGYPSAPAIANVIMHELDSVLSDLVADQTRFGNAVLTRYADDFVFSTDRRGACSEFVEAMTLQLQHTTSPRLRLNTQKTRYMSRAGGSTLITGLRINNQGCVGVHPDYRDHVRLLMSLLKKNTLRQEERTSLVGHLAYIQHVDPAFFTRLSFKYDAEIEYLRHGAKIEKD